MIFSLLIFAQNKLFASLCTIQAKLLLLLFTFVHLLLSRLLASVEGILIKCTADDAVAAAERHFVKAILATHKN